MVGSEEALEDDIGDWLDRKRNVQDLMDTT